MLPMLSQGDPNQNTPRAKVVIMKEMSDLIKRLGRGAGWVGKHRKEQVAKTPVSAHLHLLLLNVGEARASLLLREHANPGVQLHQGLAQVKDFIAKLKTWRNPQVN